MSSNSENSEKLFYSTTENGASAFETTNSSLLDFFFKLVRGISNLNLQELFFKAWRENPIMTMQILLHCRDCRNGKGEREIVLFCLNWLRRYKQKTYLKNLDLFLKVGYYKDILNIAKLAENTKQHLLGNTDMFELELFAEQLRQDELNYDNMSGPISLAAKWAPTESHADDREYQFASRLAKILYPNDKICSSLKKYRLLLTKLRNHLKVVESKMAHNKWSEISYNEVPAISHLKHTTAFKRHDEERYNKYLQDIKEGKTTIKSKGIQPHELIKPFFNSLFHDNEETIQLQWNDLINNLKKDRNFMSILPLCDVSGSMEGLPMEICIALGLVISELNEGPFKDMVLTFETKPQLIKIKDKKLKNRVQELKTASWGGSTNLTAAFEQILNSAILMGCTQEQMPKVLIIFSDMQFNHACPDVNKNPTIYEDAKAKFEAAGYKLPSVIFWNLREDTKNSFPVSMNEKGVALLSGYSAELFKLIMDDPEKLTPLNMLKKIVENYNDVVVDESDMGPFDIYQYLTVHIYNHGNRFDKRRRRKPRGKGPGSVKRGKKLTNIKNNDDSDNDSDNDSY